MLPPTVYKSLFDNSPVAEFLLSPSDDPVILAVNDTALAIVGRTRESLVGRRHFNAFPDGPGDGGGEQNVRASLARVLATGKPDEIALQRYPIRVPGGGDQEVFEERYWSAVNTPVFDEAGTMLCISQRARDVTDMWRIQDVLRRTNERQTFYLGLAERLRGLHSPREIVGAALEVLAQRLRVSRVLYAEIDDDAGTFSVHNEWAGPDSHGIGRTARPLDDFEPGVIALLRSGRPMVVADVASHPQTRDHVAAYAGIGVRANLAIPLVKAGKLTIVLSLHDAAPREWTDDEIAIATEVAERTWAAAQQARAQQALEESERAFRVLADAVPQIIWITDDEGNNLFFNRQWYEYTGQPPETVTVASVAARFVHPDDAPLTLQRLEEARRLRTTFSVEHRILRADGTYRWFLVRGEPERNPDTGEITRWFGSSTDIGALKEAEQALRDADRRKDEFLATLAHELRNPLAPVANAIAILRSPQVKEETRTRMLDLMERQMRHLVRLVDDLLEVSRITRGKIDLQLQPVDLRAVAQASVEAAAGEVQQARHEVSLRLSAQPVWVRADPARMKQVVDNLLNNAVKYTPAGGAIELEVGRRGEAAFLQVRDNGLGIPAAMLDHVFELFTQVNPTTGRSNGGLGIGLALVRQLVALHGGEVTAASDGPGSGSQFTVQMPLAQPDQPAQRDAGAGILQRARQPKRVLVMDDNRDAAGSIATAIALAGHEVAVAYDGRTGLAEADRLKPECILLDLGMPGLDGHQVARTLRDHPDHGNCLLVALTGWGQVNDRALTRQSGFDAHMVKPASVDAVMALLDGGGSGALPG